MSQEDDKPIVPELVEEKKEPVPLATPEPQATVAEAPLKKLRPLTLKELAFAEVAAKTLNQTEAAAAVYSHKDRAMASTISSRVMKRPAVQQKIRERIRELYPNLNEDLAEIAKTLIEDAKQGSPELKIKVLHTMTEILGEKVAMSERKTLTARVPFKLPSSD